MEQADIIYSGYNELTWSNLLRKILLQSKHLSKVVQHFNCGEFFKVCIIQVVHFFLIVTVKGKGIFSLKVLSGGPQDSAAHKVICAEFA